MQKLSAEKKKFINDFLQAPLIARMATADSSGQPHVVPVWYGWDGTTIWISSFSSTRKVSELELNPKISISIDTSEIDGKAKAVIFEGKAELIKEPCELVEAKSLWIYTRYLDEKGLLKEEPQSWIKDPLNLLIKLTPDTILTWMY